MERQPMLSLYIILSNVKVNHSDSQVLLSSLSSCWLSLYIVRDHRRDHDAGLPDEGSLAATEHLLGESYDDFVEG